MVDYKEESLKRNKILKTIEEKEQKTIQRLRNRGLIKSFETLTNIRVRVNLFLEKQPLFYDKSCLFWIWDKESSCYKKIDDTDLLLLLSEYGHDTISSKEKSEIMEALKQEGRRRIPKPLRKDLIQFKDTLISIENGEKYPATPLEFCTNPINCELNKENCELTPNIDRIFKEWVGKENVLTLKQIIAYCLIPSYPLHRIFCFIGGGMNGKSCFLNLLKKIIGTENVVSTELDNLLVSRFEIAKLYKKLVCMMGETNFNEISKTSTLKKLTGGDLIGFEYKNKTPFDDVNYAKILISTNNLPTTTDKTIGWYRRWLIIDFPNQFSEEKDILKEIPEEEYSCLALQLIPILRDLLKTRKFFNEGDIEERIRKYEERSNPINKFIKEFCIIKGIADDFIGKWDFENKLNDWLRENRHRSLSDKTINKIMNNQGFEDGKTYIEVYDNNNNLYTKKQIRVWFGIKWKDKQ